MRRSRTPLASLVVLLVGCTAAHAPGPSGPPAVIQTGPGTCTGGWKVVPTPDRGNSGAGLRSIATISASNIWAVGHYETVPPRYSPPPPSSFGGNPPETSHPLVEHWDGRNWKVVAAPNPGIDHGIGGSWFIAVAARTPDDVWAVGGSATTSSGLIEHWNGQRWTISPSPSVNLVDGQLDAVSATSLTDAWAVGYNAERGGGTVVEHWDGSRWSVFPAPSQEPQLESIYDVSASSNKDAWIVGSGGTRALALHWNGSQWSIVATPVVRASSFWGVQAFTPAEAWAVGTTFKDVDGRGPAYGIIERWDGSTWGVVPTPHVPSQWGLFDIAGSDPNNLWAVGATLQTPSDHELFLHWDGVRWTLLDSLLPGSFPGYHSLAVTGPIAWYVGTTDTGGLDRPAIARSCV